MPFCTNCGRQLAEGETCPCRAAFAPSPRPAGNNAFLSFLKKWWIVLASAAAAVIIAVTLICCLLGSNYKTPLNDVCRTINRRDTDIVRIVRKVMPNFIEGDLMEIYQIVKKSDDFDEEIGDQIIELQEQLEDYFNDMEDTYGSDARLTYCITDREELSKKELKAARTWIRDINTTTLGSILDSVESYGRSDWDNMADELGLSAKECKELFDELEDLSDELREISVTRGYELTLDLALSGSDDDWTMDDVVLRVIKVNGSWMFDFSSFEPFINSMPFAGLF